ADLHLVGRSRSSLEPQRLLDEDGSGGRLQDERERTVLIDRHDDGDDETLLTGGLRIKFLGETGNVDAVRAERRTDRGTGSRLSCRELKFDYRSDLFSHIVPPYSWYLQGGRNLDLPSLPRYRKARMRGLLAEIYASLSSCAPSVPSGSLRIWMYSTSTSCRRPNMRISTLACCASSLSSTTV